MCLTCWMGLKGVLVYGYPIKVSNFAPLIGQRDLFIFVMQAVIHEKVKLVVSLSGASTNFFNH